MSGRTIERLGRRGKYLLLGLDGGQTLVMHLRMTGNLVLVEGEDKLDPSEGMRLYEGERSTSERHLRARFVLDDGREVWFTDPRRFGEALLLDDADLDAHFAPGSGSSRSPTSSPPRRWARSPPGARRRSSPSCSTRRASPGSATSTPTRRSSGRDCTRSRPPAR